jgi:hypothetical protein
MLPQIASTEQNKAAPTAAVSYTITHQHGFYYIKRDGVAFAQRKRRDAAERYVARLRQIEVAL